MDCLLSGHWTCVKTSYIVETQANTMQAAELYSAIAALRAVKEFSLGADIKIMVLRTDSPYMLKDM
jgi:hypothetical protein